MAYQFYYITVATKPHFILDKIINKVTSQGEKIEVLGKNEDRYIGWHSKGNFGIKLKEVYDFLDNMDLNDNDIVLFTDAYDVIYYSNQDEIIKRYLELNSPIVFGAERLCNPDPKRESEYTFKNTEFPFLNSGMFIGRVWALRICMIGYVYDDNHDDQRFWTTQFLELKDLIKLDYENHLFLNTAEVPIDEIHYDGTTVTYKDRKPLFVHVNGPDKSDLKKFL
jgi:hypothetical protein